MPHSALGQMTTSVLGHASEQTAAHLTTRLRQHAASAGWPSRVYNGLTVGWKDEEEFHVYRHPGIQEEADDLEFGTQHQPPLAAIRQFQNRVDHHAESFAADSFMIASEAML